MDTAIYTQIPLTINVKKILEKLHIPLDMENEFTELANKALEIGKPKVAVCLCTLELNKLMSLFSPIFCSALNTVSPGSYLRQIKINTTAVFARLKNAQTVKHRVRAANKNFFALNARDLLFWSQQKPA